MTNRFLAPFALAISLALGAGPVSVATVQGQTASVIMRDIKLGSEQRLFSSVVLTNTHGRVFTDDSQHELQLRVLGYVLVSFRVFDRGSGKTITNGRGFRAIGTKQDKDVRDFANIVACL